jgi:hypothetical protein
MHRNAVCFVALLAIACTSPLSPVNVVTGSSSLRIANSTGLPVYYFVVECQLAARINWAPCTDPSRCAAVAPNGEGSVPYDQISGYQAGASQAIVYWWHLEPSADGRFQADSIRAKVVPLAPRT